MDAEIAAKLITDRLVWTPQAGRIVTVPYMVDAQDEGEAAREAEALANGRKVEL